MKYTKTLASTAEELSPEPSNAAFIITDAEIIDETLSSVSSERTSRVIDNEAAGSMERRKREGYF